MKYPEFWWHVLLWLVGFSCYCSIGYQWALGNNVHLGRPQLWPKNPGAGLRHQLTFEKEGLAFLFGLSSDHPVFPELSLNLTGFVPIFFPHLGNFAFPPHVLIRKYIFILTQLSLTFFTQLNQWLLSFPTEITSLWVVICTQSSNSQSLVMDPLRDHISDILQNSLWSSNKWILRLGVITTWGTALQGHNIRQVENHC